MFDKIKTRANAPTTYDFGLLRGFSIGTALGIALHNAETHPVLACLWVANAALFAYGARRERREEDARNAFERAFEQVKAESAAFDGSGSAR